MGRTILTYGTFDLFHIGHLNILKNCKNLGQRLIVGISTDEFNASKGKKSHFSFRERCEIVAACKYVDEVLPETSWTQKINDINAYSVDLFVMGDDWKGKFDFLKEYCEVTYLPRTIGVSTTLIRESIQLEANNQILLE